MSALGYFASKTVFVAGAGDPLGRSLCLRLAGLGATVIAQDSADVRLSGMAEEGRRCIEPLTVDLADRMSARQLREGWGSEPVHALFNLLPFRHPPEAILGLYRAMGPGLVAGGGRALSFFAEASETATPAAVFSAHGWRGFLDAVPLRGARHRVLGVTPDGPQKQLRLTALGDLALMLCHPAADALADISRLTSTPPH